MQSSAVAPPPRSPFALTLPQTWLGLAVALPILGALITSLSATDLAYHLRAGAEILQTGKIPQVDTWTFTALGREWIDQQWGAQVILAATYQLGGWAALFLLRAAVVGAIFGLVVVAIRARNPTLGGRTTGLLVLAAFVVATPALALRPQLLGIALFALTLTLIAGRGSHRRWLWAIPIVVVVWANLHGSFILAPVLLGLAWLEDLHERVPRAWLTLLIAVVAGLASVVNPLGPAIWSYAAGLSLDPAITGRITEWQPLTLRDGPGVLFWVSVGAVAVLMARRRATTPWPALATLGAFAFLAAYAARGLAWWPLVAVVVVAGLLSASSPPVREMRRSAMNGAIVALVLALGLLVSPAWRATDLGSGTPQEALTEAPSGMTAALREIVLPGDRLFNPQAWGSWFEFAVPGVLVALDSRVELFPPAVFADVDVVRAAGPAWREILDRHGVTLVMTESGADAALVAALETDPGWRAGHSDADGTIWMRADRPSVP